MLFFSWLSYNYATHRLEKVQPQFRLFQTKRFAHRFSVCIIQKKIVDKIFNFTDMSPYTAPDLQNRIITTHINKGLTEGDQWRIIPFKWFDVSFQLNFIRKLRPGPLIPGMVQVCD